MIAESWLQMEFRYVAEYGFPLGVRHSRSSFSQAMTALASISPTSMSPK